MYVCIIFKKKNNMSVTIKELNFKQLDKFISFQWKIYADDPNWVPPLRIERKEFLDPGKNPVFGHLDIAFYMAFDGKGEEVGRIAAIVNKNHNTFHEDKVGFFGLFECIHDQKTAAALFDQAFQFLKNKGCDTMRGPVNLSTNDDCGLLVEGLNEPAQIMMTYNPEYYIQLFENYGFVKSKDLLAYKIDVPDTPPERLKRGAELIQKRGGFTIRTINVKDFKNEVKRIKAIYNSAWERNWGFIPMTDAEFDHLGTQMKQILDPDFLFIAEHNGVPVGFSLTIPNINEALITIRDGKLLPFGLIKLLWHTRPGKLQSVRVITLGITPEHRNSGMDTIFYYRSFEAAIRKKIKWAEMSWILEDNIPMNRPLINMGAHVYKRYRIYDKKIA